MADPAPTASGLRPVDVAIRVVGALVVLVAIAFCVLLATGRGVEEKGESLTPETAEAGQCVAIDDDAGQIDITVRDCGRDHDAEIVHVTDVTEAIGADAGLGDAAGLCQEFMDPDDLARIETYDGDLVWGLLIDEPDNLDGYDRLVCYVQDPDGQLDEQLF
ncbi:hypothetical protein ABFT23_15255 [Nocardioides sp. C4-1]|uniref:hypothetical protein n=1 Tax=Nocardioides sp. C4-1 TaxID=3151851 RepID=UPI0032670979